MDKLWAGLSWVKPNVVSSSRQHWVYSTGKCFLFAPGRSTWHSDNCLYVVCTLNRVKQLSVNYVPLLNFKICRPRSNYHPIGMKIPCINVPDCMPSIICTFTRFMIFLLLCSSNDSPGWVAIPDNMDVMANRRYRIPEYFLPPI